MLPTVSPMKAFAFMLAFSSIPLTQSQRQIAFLQNNPKPISTNLENGAGRFLHITDMHPDQYYQPGAKVNDACHSTKKDLDVEKKKKKKKKKKGGKHDEDNKPQKAGYWGAPVSVCDSPKQLIIATLDWLAKHWTGAGMENESGFDFIIWTGDTARHDIDFTYPRNAEEIFEYNRWVLGLMEERFPNTPIVPNLGNNDIIPHNIMFPGPNSMTRSFREIWSNHIPQEQHEEFLDGGYFTKEVLKNDLAVISLNTLYWYDANAATRGCRKKNEPGSIQLDWLEDQLGNLRNRTMQVHLMGHVPPTPGNYFSDCYDRYTDIVLRFQDTIVGQHFGHMNIDAMFLQEDFTISGSKLVDEEKEEEPIHSSSLSHDLRKDFDLVPTEQKTNLDAFLPFFASSSVFPTYLPTVRIWTYNNTRPLDRDLQLSKLENVSPKPIYRNRKDQIDRNEEALDFDPSHNVPIHTLSRNHRRRGHKKKHRKSHHNLPRHASSDSPSRKNSYLTMLGYSHWVLDLEEHNVRREEKERAGEEPEEEVNYQLEYTTYDEMTLWSDYLEQEEGVESKQHIHRPVPKALLDREIEQRKAKAPKLKIGSNTISKNKVKVHKALRHLTDYRLQSFTVEHVLNFARELAGNDKLWKRYEKRLYTESGIED